MRKEFHAALLRELLEERMNQKIRDGLTEVVYEQLRKQFSGAKYKSLIKEHIRKTGSRLQPAISSCIEALNDEERDVAEKMIDIFNQMGAEKRFWQRDCGKIFEQIWCMFFVTMSERGKQGDNKIAFNIFQLITMNFAIHASQSKELRKVMGIRKNLFSR